MAWADKRGREIESPRAEHRDPVRKARARAIAMAQLQSRGWSLREIGAFFGVDHPQKVANIIRKVPADARRLGV